MNDKDNNIIIDTVNNLISKYSDNSHVYSKLNNYITNQLPELLENAEKSLIEREKRKKQLEENTNVFIENFINTNDYYYNHISEIFFEYKNNTYSIIKEDDIAHNILTSISNDISLRDWKYKIKISIIKKIKERNIFSSIPESDTIQNIIQKFYPNIFDTRIECKYFITIIGDILLKKSNKIYIVTSKIKDLLKELDKQAYMLFGSTTLLNNIKFKYYEHKFEECRLLKIKEHMYLDQWMNDIKQFNHIIDLFCVCTHYSNRYECADKFIEDYCKVETLSSYTFYLKNKTDDDIIVDFKNSMIENHEGDNCNLTWKNIFYLWKMYIHEKNIPNVFFNDKLKELLIKDLSKNYSKEKDYFVNLTSKHIPLVSRFLNFWSNNIIESEEEIELEIDEFCSLINIDKPTNNITLDDETTIDLIKHYYPDIVIEKNKYLINIGCKLWNKKKDLIDFFEFYKKNNDIDYDEYIIPIEKMYNSYITQKKKHIVSKRFMKKFLEREYATFMKNSKCINSQFLLQLSL